jgi:tRNA(Ile)-lysidine synthase
MSYISSSPYPAKNYSIAVIKNLWQWGLVIESLLDEDWVCKLSSYRKLIVGFSGGLDSTVLLHNLAQQPQLIERLSVVHIDHGLSPNASAWRNHCQDFCNWLQVPLTIQAVEFNRKTNIEAHARTARYQALSSLLAQQECVLLAHHADDQAETVLLQLFRGTGIDGLSAMASIQPLGLGELARPLLSHTRERLEIYAHQHDLHWIDDESNDNHHFSRNYLRQKVMPLLEDKWPSVVKNIITCAQHCHQAQVNLEDLAILDYCDLQTAPHILPITDLKTKSFARLVNVLRYWLKKNQVKTPTTNILQRIVTELVYARKDAIPCVEWGNVRIRRFQEQLYLITNLECNSGSLETRSASICWENFPAQLSIAHGYLSAQPASQGLCIPAGSKIIVRFRQGGETFYWRGQTKSLKKLLQQWRIPPWKRETIPLIYINNDLAAVVGYAMSDYFYSTHSPAWKCEYTSRMKFQ